MRRYTGYLFIALITFVMGFVSVRIWQSWPTQPNPPQMPVMSEVEQGIIDPRWVYIKRDIKWRLLPPPPPDLVEYWKEMNPDWAKANPNWKVSTHWKESEANGTVIIFYPSGDYAEILASLWRLDENRPIYFAPNGATSYCTYRGKWSTNPDGTISTFAKYSHVGMYNFRLPDAVDVFTRKWIVRQPAVDRLALMLEADGEVFIPASEIEDLTRLTHFVKD